MSPRNYFNINIRLLRERQNKSQEDLAAILDISRNKLQALESGKTVNPTSRDLIQFSEYFKVSIDVLFKIDLSEFSEQRLREIEAENDAYITGSKLRVLAITTDKEGKENIEFVPVKAKAGYVAGYNDPEFINRLPKFHLPHLPRDKTFRMFPITGDSMLPFKEGDFIIAEYIRDWFTVKNNTLCVVILKGTQDFVFKKVTNSLKQNRELCLSSLNDLYKPYSVKAEDILELWQYHSYWGKDIQRNNLILEDVFKQMSSIEQLLAPFKTGSV